MKKLLALLLSVWMLLCAMPAVAFAEDATVRVELTTDKIGLIFRNEEQPVIEFAICNDGATTLDATVIATVKDYDGNVVTEESAAVTVEASASVPFAPELGKVTKFGTYTLELTVTADGATLFSEVYPFSRVLTGDGTLDMFGASTHCMRDGPGWGGPEPEPYMYVLPLMKEAGLAYYRDDFNWSIMESEKGVRVISERWRGGVDYALDLGLKPLMILTYGNNLYGPTNPLKTEWLNGYVEYCKALVTEFKGQAGAYQLWNEWNIGLSGTVPDQYEGPEYYAMTAFAAAKAIREIDPDTPIILGSIAGVDINWMDYVLNYVDPITEEPLYDLIDAVSLQPYLYPNDPDSGDLYNTLKTVNDLMVGRERKEVWITEIGWPTGGADAVPEATAAANLVRMGTNFMSYDNMIDHVTWYQFHDYYQGDDNRESYFGMLRYPESSRAVPYHAKPAYLTLSAMNAKLGDAEYVDDPELGDGIIAHRFRKDDGGEVVVAWCRNTNKILTLTTDQGVTVSDMYGNVLTEGTGAVSMTLSDHPIYIEMADASKLDATANGFLGCEDITAAPGNTVELTVTRYGDYKALGGDYKLTLPEGWTAENATFAANSDVDTITVTIPSDCEAGRYTVSAVPATENDEYGRIDFRFVVTDGAFHINPAYVDGQFKLSVKVQNDTNTAPISGTVAITAPAEFAGEQLFTVAAGENAVMLFDIPAELGTTIYDVQATVTLDGGAAITLQKDVSFLYALQAVTPIEPDGIIDHDGEWKGAMEWKLGEDDWQVGEMQKAWPGNEASFYFKWDEENLYIAAEVFDKIHYQPELHTLIPGGDSLWFSIDPGKQNAPGAFGYAKVAYALCDGGRTQGRKWLFGNSETDVYGSTYNIVRDEENRMTYYEVVMPWSSIMPEGEFDGYDSVGLSVAVNERHGTKRSGWLGKEYMGVLASLDNEVKRFGDLVLVEMEHTHIMTKHEGTPATCVSEGTADYWTCSDPYCEGMLYADEAGSRYLTVSTTVIDPDNHANTRVDGAIEATPEAEGYTGDTVCADCGAVLQQGEAIAKLTPAPAEPETAPVWWIGVALCFTVAIFLPLGVVLSKKKKK